MNIGETFQPTNTCTEWKCRKDFRFGIAGCGTMSMPEDVCTEVEPDLTLAYPDCCQRFVCRNEDGTTFIA